VTPTNNLAMWCGKNGRNELLGEWAHPDNAPTDFTPGLQVKVRWTCGKCGWGCEALTSNGTGSNRTRCPTCNPPGRKLGKVIWP